MCDKTSSCSEGNAKRSKRKISEMPGVITVVETGGQFQVVIGTHVGDVFAQVSKDLDLENNPRGEEKPKQGILKSCHCYNVRSICTIRLYSCGSRNFTRCINLDYNGSAFILQILVLIKY